MKKLNYLMFAAATAMFATSCSTDSLEALIPDSEKTAIEFGGSSAQVTRAGLSKANPTNVVMQIKSQKKGSTGDNNVRVTRTVATASADNTYDDTSYSTLSFLNDYQRYWDDAYGRDAELSVYAIAVPGKTTDSKAAEDKLKASTSTWSSEELSHTVDWTVSTAQTNTTLADEDLIFSNNISGDNKMKFKLTDSNDEDGAGKFDSGNLNFTHALSRITINLKRGAGFSGENTFQFATGTNVSLNAMPVGGTLDLASGEWTTASTATVSSMYEASAITGSATNEYTDYKLMAQVLPGKIYTDGDVNKELSFTIDGNLYTISSDMMFDALNVADVKASVTKLTDTNITLEKGLNYTFNITVNKTGVAVTASIQDWTPITAENLDLTNDNIKVSVYDTENGHISDFELYRSVVDNEGNSDGTYASRGNATWYYQDNQTYYNFRSTSNVTNLNSDLKSFAMTAGSTDYQWGAPLKANAITAGVTPKYDTENGYNDLIYGQIGATSSTINMTQFHMMSQVTVQLTSTATDDNQKVDLTGSKVYITRINKDGEVLMATGKITSSNLQKDLEMTPETNTTSYIYNMSVVPQTLVRGTSDADYIGIRIETASGKSIYYYEKLSDVKASKATTSQNNTTGESISYWYPGHHYTYVFNILKTGVNGVTASLVDWTTVTGETQNISLED
ncbi:Fimbrillin-like [Segatella bryantii]|uniref:fimbrillin family protein n=1 Tax=Segatella bryantii TaxID=77095 RepID=UPI00089974E0|nr:fimbrillin family protein [Segatella bryantii]SEA06727.1 Fimbrillin-like [Segatella bryantii]